MMRAALVLGVLSLAASALLPRDPVPATSIYRFSANGSWTENLVVRPNGKILVTRMDNGELWSIDPTTKNATLVHAFPAKALTGITEVRPDVFALVSGNQDTKAQTNVEGSYAIWTVDTTLESPVVARVNNLTTLANVNGIVALDDKSVLVGDIAKGSVNCVTLSGSTCGTPLVDAESMAPPADGPPYGIDGMKYLNGTLWFTNIRKQTFNKVDIDRSGKAVGSIVKLQTGLAGDDFAFGPDGSIYITTNFSKTVVKLPPDGKGSPTVVANIDGACACQFGRGATDKDILYVVTSHGELFSVKVL